MGAFTRVSYDACTAALRLVLFFGCSPRVLGRENALPTGPWILASNHISHFDPPLLSIVCPRRIDWMAMEELFRNRTLGRILHSAGAFPVRRGKGDREAMRVALQRLASGNVVGIFPEGGIRDGDASVVSGGPMRSGAALLAHRACIPMVPCVILGSDRLYNVRLWRPWRRVKTWICFGAPIAPGDRGEMAHQLAAAFVSLRKKLVAHFGLTPVDLPQSPRSRMQEG